MDSFKTNLLSCMIYYILDKNSWSKGLGHYIYYKENIKKPPKRFLKRLPKNKLTDTINQINHNLCIDDNLFTIINKPKKPKITNKPLKFEEDTSQYIKLDKSYKFTGTNPYKDLIKPDNMPDSVYKEMIYIRSQFSKQAYNNIQYDFSECTPLSQI